MKKVLILGSTGSIGTQALDIIRKFPELFQIAGLSGFSQEKLLKEQGQEFDCRNLHLGSEGLAEFVAHTDFDILLNALSGEVGLKPTMQAIQMSKIIALANKETLVADGERVMTAVQKYGADLRPVDSEHSAIWQCLAGNQKKDLAKIILTCSGGPFRDTSWTLDKLAKVTPKEALAHPNWSMGAKISIDSATLMNKALELIEAVRLFNVSPEQVEVVLHPQSIVHSAVEFKDGSVIAQMGTADMRTAIALALSAPERLPLPFPKFNFMEQNLTFQGIDEKRFPSLQLARKALAKNKCREFNRANEKAVADFLNGKIGFLDIYEKVKLSL